MSAPYVYSGPPGRGFEPGATYDLTYPPAADDWAPVTSASSQPPAVPVIVGEHGPEVVSLPAGTTVQPSETPKETS